MNRDTTHESATIPAEPKDRKPFVEPAVSAPESILDVTTQFGFQALTAETSATNE